MDPPNFLHLVSTTDPIPAHPGAGGYSPRGASVRAEGSRWGLREQASTRFAVIRENPDLLLVALLFLAMSVGGRSFSKSIEVGPIYITEILIGAAGLLALYRLRLSGSWTALRRLPLIALAVIWALGAIATLRGLDFGISQISNDIGLVDYTLVLPLFALVLSDRPRFEAMFSVLVTCGFLGMATYFVLFSIDQISGTADTVLEVVPVSYGLYISLAVVWIVARMASGVPTPKWVAALVPIGLVLMNLSTVRSIWLVAIVALGIVALLAPAGRRLRCIAVVVAAFAISMPAALAVEHGINNVGGIESSGNSGEATGGSATAAGGDGGKTQISQEITSLGGGDSGESANVSWRLAYWKELLSRVPSDPVLGVGFGQPAAFEWRDIKYDFRDDDPNTSFNVAGPHNSFVSWIYRLGVIGALALLWVMFVAVRNAFRGLRERDLSPPQRATLVSLVGMLAAGTVVAGFNEALTGPFLGIFFWAPLAMLLLWPVVGPGARDDDAVDELSPDAGNPRPEAKPA